MHFFRQNLMFITIIYLIKFFLGFNEYTNGQLCVISYINQSKTDKKFNICPINCVKSCRLTINGSL